MVDREPTRKDVAAKAVERFWKVHNITESAQRIYNKNLSTKKSNTLVVEVEGRYLNYYLNNLKKAADPLQSMLNSERVVSLSSDIDERHYLTTQLNGKLRVPTEDIDEMCQRAKDYAALITLEAFSGPIPLAFYSRAMISRITGQEIEPVRPLTLRLPTAVEGVKIEYSYPQLETKKPEASVVFEPL